MTPIQAAFLKLGWIQIGGDDIPVFFRYEPEQLDCPHKYLFHVIFTGDRYGYYDIYNEWIEKKLMTQDVLEKNIESLIGAAFEHIKCTPEVFHIKILDFISDFYHCDRNPLEAANYEGISKQLFEKYKQLKNEKNVRNSIQS